MQADQILYLDPSPAGAPVVDVDATLSRPMCNASTPDSFADDSPSM